MEGDSDSKRAEDGRQPDAPLQMSTPEDAPEDRNQGTGAGGAKSGEKPSQFDRSLRATDIFIAVFAGLSFVAAGVNAGVAIWTALQMKSTTMQTERAIGKLADLAGQTKRQADAQSQQIDIMRGQLGEQKKQTGAISEQTTAIKSSSLAAVQSAQAQTRMANVTAIAQTPHVSLSTVQLDGLGDAPDKDGLNTLKFTYDFENAGGGTLLVDNVHIGIYVGNVPVDDPANSQDIPGGQFADLPGRGFKNTEPIEYTLPKADLADVLDNRKTIFVVGKVNFSDMTNTKYTQCFSYALRIKNKAVTAFTDTRAKNSCPA